MATKNYREALGHLTHAALALDPGPDSGEDALSDDAKLRLAFLKDIASVPGAIDDLMADDEEKGKAGSTQFDLPPDLARLFILFARRIPSEDLAGKGIEIQPHVTCKYGLSPHVTADEVADLTMDTPPVVVTFGPTAVFAGEDHDVLYVAVHSPDLHRLHHALSALPHMDTHAQYVPHATLAYLMPGTGQKYAGRKLFDGLDVELRTLKFSPAEGDDVTILLNSTEN